jgi:hypothetical protein
MTGFYFMDTTIQRCPDCGAVLTDGQPCETYFHQMLFWEAEYPAIWEVHHLMVVCYYLQHPHLYSPDGLKFSAGLLADFVARGISPQEVRQRDRDKVDSGKRDFKIKGKPGSQGRYENKPPWTLTAGDVVAGGIDRYIDNVRAWAKSMYEALVELGFLAAEK